VSDPDANKTYLDYNIIETRACPGPGTATALLTGIRYNFGVGSGATTPLHTVALTYVSSGNVEVQAINGCMVSHDLVLHNISISRATSPSATVGLGSWSLVYSLSADTHRERLDSIQANDRNGAAFGIPTAFSYETDSAANFGSSFETGAVAVTYGADNGLATFTYSQSQDWGLASNPTQAATFIDIDGDGLPDLVWGGMDGVTPRCPSSTSGCSGPTNPGLRWARNLSQGNGNPVFSDINIIPGSTDWTGFVSALNTDGSTPGGRTIVDHRIDYKSRSLGISGSVGVNGLIMAPVVGPAYGSATLLMDFDGDGAPDLISVGCGGNPTSLSVWFSQFDVGAPNNRSFGTAASPSGRGQAQCVDASAPYGRMNTLFSIGSLVLVYTNVGARPYSGGPVPTHTWVQLADYTGDGIADFIIADPNSATWYVYPGYRTQTQTGSWAFSSNYLVVNPVTPWVQTGTPSNIYPIRTVLGPETADTPTFGDLPTPGGETAVDFRDFNGDGLPDRIVAAPLQDRMSNAQVNWYVDYNTGTGFTTIQSGTLPTGMYQMNAPLDQNWVATKDTAFVDLNRDGRPDFVSRWGNCGQPPSNIDNLMFLYNAASGLGTGKCLGNPAGTALIRPYDNFLDSDFTTRGMTLYNEGLYDLDGDGVLDFVRAPAPSEKVPANQWLFYQGRHQSRRSDLLISMTSSTGLSHVFHWAPSSAYGVRAGIPFVSDVISSIDWSGPAMSPLTTTYSYSAAQTTAVWDDPTGAQQEYLGYAQLFETPSIGGVTRQTIFGSIHATAGVPVTTCEGTSSVPCSATSSPSVIGQTQTAWATSSIGTNCSGGICYPLYLYASSQRGFRTELSSSAISLQTNGVPDSFGNILTSSVVGDALSSTATSLNITRVFATGAGSNCVSCMVEEVVSDPASGTDLAHTYYHYDLPVGSTSNGRDPTSVSLGHLSYVESLVSGSGPSGQYEVPQLVYYGATGTISSIVKTYAGQQMISQVPQSITYDPVNGYDIT